jgi:hypothetical protein
MVTVLKETTFAKVTKVTMVTKISNHTSLYDNIASGANVDTISQVSSSAPLLLPVVGN